MLSKFFSLLKPKYILTGLTVLCVVFIVVSFFTDKLVLPLKNVVSYVTLPMQKGMNYMGMWVSDEVDSFQEVQELIKANEELQSKVDELTEENNQLKQNQYELDRLRELYALDQKYSGYDKVGARIIGTASDNWYSTFTVDKGRKDGIEVDMNVIAGGGLVGIVTEVGDNYSVIKTVIEDGSYVSAMLIDTGDTCAVKGNIQLMDEGIIEVEHFKSSSVVRNGDKLITSNISDKYLPGILIGYVKDVKLDSNNLTKSGYVVPAVDFAHLQEVLIIKQKKGLASS